MKLLFFLFSYFYLTLLSHAQNNIRVQYDLHYVIDSNNAKRINRETFSLFIYEKQSSYFVSNITLYNDSILKSLEKVPISLGSINKPGDLSLKKTGFQWIIAKNRALNNINVFDKIGKISGNYDFNIALDWEILDSSRVIGEYQCLLARTKYAGRNYLAWFSPELPISDGPYIFSGLPGLILEIFDTNMHYFFKTKSIDKITIPPLIFNSLTSNSTTFKRNDFLNMRNQRQKDPINYIENSMNIKSLDLSTKEQIIKNMARKNNFIEREW